MQPYQEEDIVNNALELLSVTSTWLLVRHQWLINTMRCVLTGENAEPLSSLYDFDKLVPKEMQLPEHLIENFTEIKRSLEAIWQETTKASHPMSGLTIFEQLNKFQDLAHRFMLASTEANQQLIHDFAMRDPLTGARTRLTLTACLHLELDRTKRYTTPSTIVLLDQDSFKSINDHWGHVIGDQVIVKTADIIQENLRPTDKLFRFGGDEWLIVMPSTSHLEAEQAVERIKQIYIAHEFIATDNDSIFSSFSYGIAESGGHADSEKWIAEADKQLYSHKRKA